MKYSFEEKKKWVYTVMAVFFVFAAGMVYFITAHQKSSSDIADNSVVGSDISNDLQSESVNSTGGEQLSEQPVSDTEQKIIVYVCGAVLSEGVYELNSTDRVADAIEAAGGFAKSAAKDYLNLAGKISDGEKIVVYTKKELKNMGNPGDKVPVSDTNTTTSQTNINTASKEELMSLPGIGESKADAIITYRNENGGFKSVDELKNITGIKEGVYSKIVDSITVE